MKRMVRLASIVLVVMMTFGIFIPESEARWSSNNRRAVVLEAFYALRPSHDGGCDKTITTQGGTWCVSNWNYLNNDWGAYNTVRNFSVYQPCHSSVWAFTWESCYAGNAGASFYNDISTYGYGTFGGSNGSVGRGGQCKYFANLILYRSASDQQVFPNYPTMWANSETNLQTTKEGDIILVYNTNGYINHTAIVVEIKRSGTTVTGLDTVDANWVSDNGQSGREVIGRHLLSISYLQQHSYRIWKNISYYNEPYIP